MKIRSILLVLMAFCLFKAANAQPSAGYLRLIEDNNGQYAYLNKKGDTVIPFGKYIMCFTEKFYSIAFVVSKGKGMVGIDRKENVLFNVFVFDNGPDYLSDGLFRIVKDGKIGYADMHGRIVIQPQYDCAYPFNKGKARVGKGCTTQSDGEHSSWAGGEWVTINKEGKVLNTAN